MKVWIDGEIVDGAQARVPVTDHGLLYGDGVFEGLRVYAGRVFRIDPSMVPPTYTQVSPLLATDSFTDLALEGSGSIVALESVGGGVNLGMNLLAALILSAVLRVASMPEPEDAPSSDAGR